MKTWTKDYRESKPILKLNFSQGNAAEIEAFGDEYILYAIIDGGRFEEDAFESIVAAKAEAEAWE